MFWNRGNSLINFIKKSNNRIQSFYTLNQVQPPLLRPSFYAREKFRSIARYKHTDFNSYTYLRKWLENDLDFESSTASLTDLKKILAAILKKTNDSANLDEHQKKLIHDALNSGDSQFISHIKHLYMDTFFTEQQYNESINNFENASTDSEAAKKLKTLDRPHTLAYVALLSNDPRRLNQLDRATAIVIAALNLYQRFKNKNYTAYMNPNGDMDTSSYRNFFGVTTHPGDSNEFDVLDRNHDSQNIIIMHLGCPYELKVYDDDGLLSIRDIKTSIYHILQSNIKDASMPCIGSISTASSVLRKKVRNFLLDSSKDNLNCLENALFVLCLDDKPYPSNEAEFIYAHGFENRYFGNTQFIVGTNGEAAVIANYVKIDGTPAVELIDTIYHDSLQVQLPEISLEILNIKKLDFPIDIAIIKTLETDTKLVTHNVKSSYTIPIGIDFFKDLKLSPNITMNLIVLMAVYNINNKLPVFNHATSRRDQGNPAAQLDWNYICPSKINKFILACENIPLLIYDLKIFNSSLAYQQSKMQKNVINMYQEDGNIYYSFYYSDLQKHLNGLIKKGSLPLNNINISILNSSEKNHLIYYILNFNHCISGVGNIFNLLEHAVSSCKENIYSAKRGMSPVFFVSKPQGKVFDELCDFYLTVGKHYPAYRNYLFRAFRNEKSIDIMTSSLNLPKSIKTIGRHGTCSEVLSEFGLHILMKSNETEFVFIPNRECVHKLDVVVENIILWANKINMISHAKFIQEKQKNNTSQIISGKKS